MNKSEIIKSGMARREQNAKAKAETEVAVEEKPEPSVYDKDKSILDNPNDRQELEFFDAIADVDSAKEVLAEKERLEQELDEVKQEVAVIKEKAIVPQADGTMAMGRVKIDKAGLSIPPDLSKDEWDMLGEHLFRTEASLQWCIGDWIVYGEDKEFSTIQEIADAVHKRRGTIYNWAWISRTFPRVPEIGETEADVSYRYETLTHTHHQMIASLVKDNNQYSEWLKKAAKGTANKPWSVSELKKAIASEKVKELPSRTETVSPKTFRELMRVRRRDVSKLSAEEIKDYLEQVEAMREFLNGIESKLTQQSSKAKKGKRTE